MEPHQLTSRSAQARVGRGNVAEADWIAQVVTSQGDEVFFKIKRNTKLTKLRSAYANKVGKDLNSIRCVSCVP